MMMLVPSVFLLLLMACRCCGGWKSTTCRTAGFLVHCHRKSLVVPTTKVAPRNCCRSPVAAIQRILPLLQLRKKYHVDSPTDCLSFRSARLVHTASQSPTSSLSLSFDSESGSSSNNNITDFSAHPNTTIVSPVLQKLYPALLDYRTKYGHVNIPLGSTEGRQCVTLRRLRTQQKLVDSEIAVLDSLNFTWHSLEDVYQQQKEDFDDFLERLRLYAAQHEGDVSPPKKYPADPELGAWVTALRRLYPTGQVDPAHVAKLDRLGFSWTSPRQCGSTFMQQYRTIRERLLAATNQNEESSSDSAAAAAADVFKDPSVTAWIRAQQQQASSLSETRKHYMVQLLGPDWMTVGTADSCLPSLGTTDATV